MDKSYDAILIPGGGLTSEGKLPEWSKRRLEKSLQIYNGQHIIVLSAGTVHKTPILDEEGYPLFESGVAANYLVEEGIGSEKILREWASYDTVGNAYFARVIHTDPRQWRKLAVITSEFHMARTRETFKWVFSLGNPRPSYKLKFISVTDKGINPEIILPRIEKEVSEKLLKVKKGINDLKQFHAWLFANHEAYAVAAKPKRESGDVLKSY